MTKKTKAVVDEPVEFDEPEGGIEIVPLAMMNFKTVRPPYGPQYVSGKLMANDLTFPGVPVFVKSWLFVKEQLLTPLTFSGALQGCLPGDMTLDKLPLSIRGKFGNNKRWPKAAPKPE